MLEAIGVDSIDDLFDEIPAHLRASSLEAVPEGMTEMEVSRLMHQRADSNTRALCFMGAGAYQHHILGRLSTDLVGDLDLDFTVVWDRTEKPQQRADGTFPEQDDYRVIIGLGYEF